MENQKYSPIVLSGPSGAGKTEIIDYIENKNDEFKEAMGITTRARRPNEQGKMKFITLEEFEQEIQNNRLIE